MDEFVKLMAEYRSDIKYDESEWARLTRHVLGKLEKFLELPVHAPVQLEDYVGDDTWFEISSPHPFAGGLELTWRGIFYVVVVENIRPIEFGVTLFLYSRGRKLNRYKDDSYLPLEYRIEDGEGKWFAVGWLNDEYSEFTQYNIP